MKELIRFLVVCLLLIAQYVSAKEVKDLFTEEVIVLSQSREDRNTALREALVTVLNRVGAGRELMLDSAVRQALNNAASYVDQYQYVSIADASDANSSRKMRVLFNEDAVMELMRNRGLAVWSKDRDEVLLWIVIKQRGKQALLDVEQNTEFNEALQAAAQLKGIPIMLPLMDLEERQAVSVEDVVSVHAEKIQEISKRYGVSAILSGLVVRQGSCWRSEWALHFNKKVERWDIACEELGGNLTTAVQGVYDHLSVFYAEKLR